MRFLKGYPTGVKPQNVNKVPWKQMLPMRLQNEVSGKTDKTSESVCLQEMANMYTCFKNSDFLEKPCMSEIETYRKCVFVHMEKRKEAKQQLKAGKLNPGSTDLNFRQVNILLQRYPQHNDKK